METKMTDDVLQLAIVNLQNIIKAFPESVVQVEAASFKTGTETFHLRVYDGTEDHKKDVAWSPFMRDLAECQEWISRRRVLIALHPAIEQLEALGFEVKEKENG